MKLLKTLTIVVAMAVMTASVAPSVLTTEAVQTVQASGMEAYALRDAQAQGLDQFVGGYHEVIGFILFLVVVVWILDLISGPFHHGHGPHRHHPHGPVYP